MKLFILIMFSVIILSGCHDKTEPNDIAFVTAVGIDKSEQNDDNLNITFQIAKPAQISGGSGEEGGKGGEIIQNITVEAPTIYAGIEIANFIISKTISLSHIKLFVFSEEISGNGIADLTETMTRSEEIRPNVFLAVSKTSAKEYLESVNPAAEINPAKYYEEKFDKEVLGGVSKSTNTKFYFYQKGHEKNAILPLTSKITSNQKDSQTSENNSDSSQEGQSASSKPKENEKQKDAPLNQKPFEYKIKNYIAGQLAIAADNESEIMGAAVFKGDKMVGEMGSTDTLIYNILTNEFRQGYVTFSSKKTNTPITILLKRTRKTKIRYDKNYNKTNIKLYLEGEFISLPADYITEKDTKSFEKEIKSALKESFSDFVLKTKNEFNSDILGIGLNAKQNFLTYDEFLNYNWEEKFKETSVNIDVNFKIIRTGLTIRTEKK